MDKDYEMTEALKVELGETYAENDLLKVKLSASERSLEYWKNELKRVDHNASISIKAADARTAFALKSQMEAEKRAEYAEKLLKSNTLYWKGVADKANTRLAALMAEKQKTSSSSDPDETVERALRNALTPHSKLKIMADMVGVKNIDIKNHDYIKLKRTVLKIVHEDRRSRNDVSRETAELYECICRRVNSLPSL